jgi:hypothetical protein
MDTLVDKTSFYIGVGVVFTPKEDFKGYSYPGSILAEVPHYSKSYRGLLDSQKLLIINPLEKQRYLCFTGLTDSTLGFYFAYENLYPRRGCSKEDSWQVLRVETQEAVLELKREKVSADLDSLALHPEVQDIAVNSLECDVTFLCLRYQNPQ